MLTRLPHDTLPIRAAGGDNEVPRDHMGRPKIILPCPNEACASGRIPSEKKPPPATIQCPKCRGAGHIEKAYTRTTTFIDVIEDKSNLMAWSERMALIGATLEPSLTEGVLEHWDVLQLSRDTEEIKKAKDWLNRRAKAAKDKAGASEKADRGTHLHGLSELVDQGIALPDDTDFDAVIDMDAYQQATFPLLDIVHMERLMVLDEFNVGGTPDRVSSVREGVTLVAPDGHVFTPMELIITDLKTGTVDYGALKMAMQLAIYSRSKLYDWKTGAREEIKNLNQKWGIIMNVPAGTGECHLLWVDLEMGWRAVRIAREIRQLRNEGKKALTSFRAVSVGGGV